MSAAQGCGALMTASSMRIGKGGVYSTRNGTLLESVPPGVTTCKAPVVAPVGTVVEIAVPVELTVREFDVLICLIEARGEALSREAIFARVWGPNHHGTPRTIDNFVQQLRAKLEVDPQRPEHVITVRGVGYRFDA